MKKYKEFLDIFGNGTPDFQNAEIMIKNGLDINYNISEICGCLHSNLLAEVICCMEPGTPPFLCETIRFFFKHGFDVHKNNNNYGRECLSALAFSTYDKQIITAAKLLLDAGAKMSGENGESDYAYSPFRAIGTERNYLNTCENDYYCGNIFEALYQILTASFEGRKFETL